MIPSFDEFFCKKFQMKIDPDREACNNCPHLGDCKEAEE